MKEPVEKMLTSRIRQVFEEFEDPSADVGWAELRKKYPERNRRPLILWLSSSAAILLLVTGLWLVDQSEEKIALKPVKDQKITVNRKSAPQVITRNPEKEILRKDDTVLSRRQETVSEWNREITGQPFSQSREITEAALSLATVQVVKDTAQVKILAPRSANEMQMSKAASLALKDRGDFSLTPIDPIRKPVYIKEFNPELDKAVSEEKRSEDKTKKLALSVFAGSYVNYAEGSENQLNFGAGFNSDFRLSKNLKLSTGLSIASHSLSYDNAQNLPAKAYLSFDSANTNSPGAGNLTTITSYNASLLALDIPVNVKYQFVPESDKLYVLAGLSSGTFLNETYAYHYRNFSTASGNYVSQTQDQKIKKQLNKFDLGQTLNFSFGLSRDFGKTQSISIEPFLKYPLSGLGSEDLKFGSAGVNLKLRFSPLKKINMKPPVLILLFSIFILTTGCEKSSSEHCGGDRPEKSLTWLETKIEVLASSPFCYSIARSTYKNQTVFIVSTCDPNVDSRRELYDCNGNQLTLTTEEYQNLNFTGNIDLIWKNR